MQLTPHFTLEEFTRSSTAVRLGIDNTLPQFLLPKAVAVAQSLERIRAYLSTLKGYEVPISVTSAWRCLSLNAAVGSKPTSDHPLMLAVDWTAPSYGTPYEVCKALEHAVDSLGIGQLIHEFGEWVHTSIRMVDKPVNRIITISHVGTVVGIERV